MRIDDLIARGLTSVAAASKAELFGKCEAALTSMAAKKGNIQPAAAGRKSPFSLFVPGRIEVLGKHTDYCGGRSLVCAADRGFCVLAFPRDDALVRITDVVAGESREFEFSPELLPPLGDWANYPMTVARRLARNFPGKLRGAEIAFASDLPPAAGMSSSSALIIACFLALARINDLPSCRSTAKISTARRTWPVTSPRTRTARTSARSWAIRAWARSAAARTTRPSSAASPRRSPCIPTAQCGSSGRSACPRAAASPSAPAAWWRKRPARRWPSSIAPRCAAGGAAGME